VTGGEAGDGVDGVRRWWFNTGGGSVVVVSKLGFRFFRGGRGAVASSDDISGHRSLGGGGGWIGGRLTVRRCGEAAVALPQPWPTGGQWAGPEGWRPGHRRRTGRGGWTEEDRRTMKTTRDERGQGSCAPPITRRVAR
jgi:hypothetical protein